MAKEDTKPAAVPYMYYVAVLVVCLAAMVAATEVREFSVSRKRAAAGGAMAGVLLTLLPHVWAGLKRFFCGNESSKPAPPCVVFWNKATKNASSNVPVSPYASGQFFKESDRKDRDASSRVQGHVSDIYLSDSQKAWDANRPSPSPASQKKS